MRRRNLLKLIAATGVGTSISITEPFPEPLLKRAIARADQSSWGYDGDGNPAHWGALSSDYRACSIGTQQSPVNLQDAIETELLPIAISYQSSPITIRNNGRTIQVNVSAGNNITLGGTTFELLQFHFHHPSEHQLSGKAYPMEMHLVHRSESGELAVLGVFLQEGQANATLEPVWPAIPDQFQPETTIHGVTISLADLLPVDRNTYRYFGSLTTPPCSETVRWIVFDEPIEVSTDQINQFAKIFPFNARPTQPLNHRRLLHSI